MNTSPKCPKCGNTTFQVSNIPIAGHENYEVVICGADKCGAIITSYIPMAHTFLIEMQVKLDELLKRLAAP
jgi:ribosomal protein S27AE